MKTYVIKQFLDRNSRYYYCAYRRYFLLIFYLDSIVFGTLSYYADETENLLRKLVASTQTKSTVIKEIKL